MNFSFSEVKTSFDNRSVFQEKNQNNNNMIESNTKVNKNFVALEKIS